MRLVVLLFVLFYTPYLSAQTVSKPAPAKSRATLKAESDVQAVTAERDQLRIERDSLIEAIKSEQTTSARLKKENDALTVNSAYRIGLLTILDKEVRGVELNDLERQVVAAVNTDTAALNTAADIEKNVSEGLGIIKRLIDDNSKLTDRYNSLFADYKDYVGRAEIRLQSVRQARLANDLAGYNAMPRYSPPRQVNMNVTISDCTKLPALCIH